MFGVFVPILMSVSAPVLQFKFKKSFFNSIVYQCVFNCRKKKTFWSHYNLILLSVENITNLYLSFYQRFIFHLL